MRQQVFAFAFIAIPLVLTPGITTTLVLRTSLLKGLRAGLLIAAGAALGSVCYGFTSGAGTSVLLVALPQSLAVLQIAGASYLAWIGARAAWRSLTGDPGAMAPPVRTGFREGFLANVLNPPVALFYFLVVPRFVPPGAPVFATTMLLTGVHVSLAFVWHATCAGAAGALSPFLASTSARRAIDVVTGAVLIAFAVRMLVR